MKNEVKMKTELKIKNDLKPVNITITYPNGKKVQRLGKITGCSVIENNTSFICRVQGTNEKLEFQFGKSFLKRYDNVLCEVLVNA